MVARTCSYLVGLWAAFFGAALALDCQLQIGDPEVFRIARLQGYDRELALRALLADSKSDLNEAVFYYGDRLRAALRVLLKDARVGESAAGLLAFIAAPDDVKAIIGSPPSPKNSAFGNRWAYDVATSLLEPTSDEEWSFLRKCALNELDDLWVDAGAIQTLKLLASPRSRAILEDAQKRNTSRRGHITRALDYIDANPTPLSGSNIQALAEHIAQAVSVGEWKGNTVARCNESGDRALVKFTFESGSDRLIYTATFHRSDTMWKLRGVRETMQMMLLRPTVLPINPKR